jgi:uncharacterized protein (UPF0332 family)
MMFFKLAESDSLWDATNITIQQACYERAYSRTVALLLLQNSNQAKYGSVLAGLASQYALKQDQYPKTLTHAVSILSDRKYNPQYTTTKKDKLNKAKSDKDKAKQKIKEESEAEKQVSEELNFAQLEGVCYCCGKKGHQIPQCTKKDKTPKSEWAINKTKEASFITAASSINNQNVAATTPPSTLSVASTTSTPPFEWMALNLAMSQGQTRRVERLDNPRCRIHSTCVLQRCVCKECTTIAANTRSLNKRRRVYDKSKS